MIQAPLGAQGWDLGGGWLGADQVAVVVNHAVDFCTISALLIKRSFFTRAAEISDLKTHASSSERVHAGPYPYVSTKKMLSP